MRTPEQIKNLRDILASMYGLAAFFISDEIVDKWADNLQQRIINPGPGSLQAWEIRVRTEANINEPWTNIEKEPLTPFCFLYKVSNKCVSLLDKFPTIIAIQVIGRYDGFTKEYVFDRSH